MKVERPKVH